MIFEGVAHIRKKDEFLEKILIYIRLVETLAARDALHIDSITSPSIEVVNEMIDMGVIESVEDTPLLKKVAGDLYLRFVSAVSLYLNNKPLFGSLLDKLSNKRRKSLQQEEDKKDKPTMVDFFAGAGGLSCGFTQAGFKVRFANDFEDVCVRTYKYNHPELSS